MKAPNSSFFSYTLNFKSPPGRCNKTSLSKRPNLNPEIAVEVAPVPQASVTHFWKSLQQNEH